MFSNIATEQGALESTPNLGMPDIDLTPEPPRATDSMISSGGAQIVGRALSPTPDVFDLGTTLDDEPSVPTKMRLKRLAAGLGVVLLIGLGRRLAGAGIPLEGLRALPGNPARNLVLSGPSRGGRSVREDVRARC